MKIRIALLSAALLLALTGCAHSPANAGDERTAPVATESSAPLTAETTEPEISDADVQFLTYVRENLLPETQVANAADQQLIEAGHEACRQLESGVALEDVRVVEGETAHPTTGAFYDSIAIRSGAEIAYCPNAS